MFFTLCLCVCGVILPVCIYYSFCSCVFKVDLFFALYVFEVDLFKVGGGLLLLLFILIFQNSVEQFYDTF